MTAGDAGEGDSRGVSDVVGWCVDHALRERYLKQQGVLES